MRFPDELAEKTKALFQEEKLLHEAVDSCDVGRVMECLNEMMASVTHVINEWYMVKMKHSIAKDEKSLDLSSQVQIEKCRAA